MDFFGIGTALNGALNFGASLYNTDVNRKIAESNLDFQKNNLAYQMALQNTIFQREDNAIQRRVNDLKKAGLSPVLAAGNGAGSGAVVSTSAPQNGFKSDISFGNALADLDALRLQAQMQKQTIEQMKLQNENIKAQNEQIQSTTEGQKISNRANLYDLEIAERSGMTTKANGEVANLFKGTVENGRRVGVALNEQVVKPFKSKVSNAWTTTTDFGSRTGNKISNSFKELKNKAWNKFKSLHIDNNKSYYVQGRMR